MSLRTHPHQQYKTDFRLREALLEFCLIEGWNDPHALTLTLKQAQRIAVSPEARAGIRACAAAEIIAAISDQQCVRTFRHFMNLMNRRTYGNAAARYGKRLRVIPILEGDLLTRYHYHVMMDRPAHVLPLAFANAVREAWLKTEWGHNQIDIKAGADAGWLRYMAKPRTKRDFDLSIDWMNFSNS